MVGGSAGLVVLERDLEAGEVGEIWLGRQICPLRGGGRGAKPLSAFVVGEKNLKRR